MIYANVYDIVCDNVYLELDQLIPNSRVFLKLEGLNPAGSIKIKTAVGLVASAEERGSLEAGGRVIESSSGNLGIALGMVCAAKGYRLTIVTDANANRSAVRAMEALGVRVLVIEQPDASGGFLHRRIGLIERELADDPKLVWLNQYANPANPQAHRDRTAPGIHNELGQVDVLVVGVGTSGTLMGCVEYRRRTGMPTRLVAVDAAGSVTFGHPPQRRLIPGLGASRRPEIFVDSGDFEKVIVSEEETVAMCRHMARQYGVLVGGSTGTVLAAACRVGSTVSPGSRVVVVSPDMGGNYLDSIYSDSWVAENISPAASEAEFAGSGA
ncbi:2,3-diaminopropionate biosynthesis protein SbnA [Actinomadura rubrisoli]|uniref:2,3-diaminopropionate biosynthesis protein SbnA n=1 Tax=Actinomadura rubrisoli TaxID=2530368 RepID=A0A4R5AMF6_9ACTN|nr:2,3-diaminopropionate biosynthesis protein SbnA [Actinomadura rubrisoli]TDD72214.1 2,3-diaminopropionate biosynthesis protein SbnA [Actinomadura rubrisoli]